MATPYKIAYSHEEKAQINAELNALLKSTKRDRRFKIKVEHKIVKHQSQWEFYIVPK
jgi:hypothetical protein